MGLGALAAYLVTIPSMVSPLKSEDAVSGKDAKHPAAQPTCSAPLPARAHDGALCCTSAPLLKDDCLQDMQPENGDCRRPGSCTGLQGWGRKLWCADKLVHVTKGSCLLRKVEYAHVVGTLQDGEGSVGCVDWANISGRSQGTLGRCLSWHRDHASSCSLLGLLSTEGIEEEAR